MREKFSPLQRSTLLLCFFAYASAYTGRLNLSAAENAWLKWPSICKCHKRRCYSSASQKFISLLLNFNAFMASP